MMMAAKQLTIGQALAFLDVENARGIQQWKQLSEVEMETLNQLRQRLGAIKSNRAAGKIIKSLPKSACSADAYIGDNWDFFLSCLILRASEAQEVSDNEFFGHMNSCCKCFEIFAEILREYFRQYRVLADGDKITRRNENSKDSELLRSNEPLASHCPR